MKSNYITSANSNNQNLGLIHIYCGDGKGKTTAATGLAIRMAGAGYRILIARFLKNEASSELNILKTIPGINVIETFRDFGFIWNMSKSEKEEAAAFYTRLLTDAMQTASNDNYNMLILDEINVAIDLKLVPEELMIQFVKKKPAHLELVLTGRNPRPALLELADYVSEIHSVKHPFEKGICSRIGIEE
ncbi:MAG: cob(I)yrinic acid a,c-diamide adenosyltransferase [Lachnospiraceae bacterium]|nr:cob(I)yrinic acid a,c-diamide adenosyltransferase [Lachnospiraceae bacterium]